MGKAATKAKNKYNESNYDRIEVVVKKGYKGKIKERAQSLGLSVNAYIVKAIEMDIETA